MDLQALLQVLLPPQPETSRRVRKLDQLLDRAGDLGVDPIKPVLDGIDRDLAMTPVGFPAEAAMRRRANPGIDLTGGADVLGFVQEALAGVLDRFLDRVGRDVGIARCELRPQRLAASGPSRRRLRNRSSVAMLASGEAGESDPITTTGREGEKLAPSLAAAVPLTTASALLGPAARRGFLQPEGLPTFWDY